MAAVLDRPVIVGSPQPGRDQAEQYSAAVAFGLEMLRPQARHQHKHIRRQGPRRSCGGRFVMSSPDAGDERGLTLRTDVARTRILTGVRLGSAERAALERIVTAGQAEQRRAGS